MFSPGKDRNFIAALKRTMDSAWYGADVSNRAQPPTILNGEYVTAVNAAGTGVVNLIGADAKGQTVFATDVAIPITSAQILTLNSAPVQLVPAPGAGKAIVVRELIIEMNRTATAYTGGGAVGPTYRGAATAVTAVMAAADLTTAGAAQVVRALANNIAGGPAVVANAAIDLFAASADFAAGTGTMKVFVLYSILTL